MAFSLSEGNIVPIISFPCKTSIHLLHLCRKLGMDVIRYIVIVIDWEVL